MFTVKAETADDRQIIIDSDIVAVLEADLFNEIVCCLACDRDKYVLANPDDPKKLRGRFILFGRNSSGPDYS